MGNLLILTLNIFQIRNVLFHVVLTKKKSVSYELGLTEYI